MAERLADPAGAPPITVWWLTAALVVLVTIGLWYWMTGGKAMPSPFLVSAHCEIGLKSGIVDRHPGILAVGTSLLGASTEPAKDFDSRLGTARWHPCWVSSGSWGDLARALPTIAVLKPQILILHEGVLVDASGDTLQGFFAAVFAKIREQLGWAIKPDRSAAFACGAGGLPEDGITLYSRLLKPQSAIFAEARAWISRLEAAGTQVVLLDIPRSETLEAQLGPILTERRMALQQLAVASGARYWSLDAPAGPQAYCPDQAHMAVDGRNQFAPQLVQRLQHEFAGAFK